MNLKYIVPILLLPLFCFCSSCEDQVDNTKKEDSSFNGFNKVALQSEITSVQPMTGIVFWPTRASSIMKSYESSISLEYSYCLPSDVVKGKENGVIRYDWSSFEETLNAIISRNHQAIVRFRYEYPNALTNNIRGGTAVPDYIKALSDYNETFNENPGGDGPTYYADWSNAELQWFTKQFYTDFAAKYDKDPRIAFLQVGFGHWSEYHIYGNNLRLGVNFPTHEYQDEFLKHVDSVFESLPWSISIDAADGKYSPIVKTPSLMNLNFGLFDDSFMHSKHEISQGGGYNERSWISIGTDRWKKSPAGGEISYYTRDDQKNFLNPEGMYGFTWEEMAEKYHITYMIGNDAPSATHGTAERMKEASMASGYKFEVTDFRVKEDSSYVEIKNIGIAPIYKDAFVTVNGKRSDLSLKGLLPDSTITTKISSGGTEPVLTITSDFILESQRIEYVANIELDN